MVSPPPVVAAAVGARPKLVVGAPGPGRQAVLDAGLVHLLQRAVAGRTPAERLHRTGELETPQDLEQLFVWSVRAHQIAVRHGLAPQHAILEASQRRLRPILLTTLTTIGGLIPLYLGGGPMWQPMAVAIMAGLAFATTLTLGLVPVLYALFFRVSFKNFRHEQQ